MATLLEAGIALRDKYLSGRGLESDDFGLNFSYPIIPGTNWDWFKSHHFSTKEIYRRSALFLVYLNPKGDPYFMVDDGLQIPYGVVRFLGTPVGVPEGEEAPKMLSQWGRRSEIHFEPMRDGRSWETLEHGSKVIHCESLVKAKAVHKATGLPCVGYNGVNGYSSAKQGVELIHQYTGFAFDKMHNIILYDSDVHTNDRVRKSRQYLSHKLRHIASCSMVSWATLPQREDPKTGDLSNWGPDDFIVARGRDSLMEIIESAEIYQDEEYSDLVDKMNTMIRWVNDQNMVYDRRRRVLIPWTDAQLAFKNVNRIVPMGKVKRTIYGTDVWLQSVNREEVSSVGYRYRENEFFDRGGAVIANEYVEDGATPGSETLESDGIVMDMLTRLFKRDDLELIRSYLKFLKYTGDKPTSYCVLWSHVRGVGKGWFTEACRALIGRRHVSATTADMLAEKYNLHTINCRMLIAHEFQASSASNRKLALNYLKTYVGDELVPVRAMRRNPYTAEVRAGLVITVNDKMDMPSDGLGDRRQWYIEGGAGLIERGVALWEPESQPWTDAWNALRDPDQMSRFARWVLDGNDIDFKSWRPPMTEERMEALMEGQSTPVQVAHEVLVWAREVGIRVMDGKAIRQLMTERMDGREVMVVAKAFGKCLKDAGWQTDKQYERCTESKSAAWFTSTPDLRVPPSMVTSIIREDAAKVIRKY